MKECREWWKTQPTCFWEYVLYTSCQGWWLRWQKICLQCGRPGFNPWVGMISQRRNRQPTPVFLLGESHGQQSLAGYSPWGHKESDTTEPLSTHCIHLISLVIPQFCWSQSVFESLCLFLTRSGLMSVGWMEVVYPLIRLLSHFLLLSCGRFLVHILALSYWVPLASLLSSSTAEVQFSEWTRAQKPWWKISSFGLQLGRLWRASLAFWLPCVHAHVHA